MISGLKPRKIEGRYRRGQIVALGLAVAEEGLGHHAADAVLAQVTGIGLTEAIPVPAGHRFTSADLQWLSQNVVGCGWIGAQVGHPDAWIPGESDEGVAHFVVRQLTNPRVNAVKVVQLCPLDGLGVH